MKRGDASFSLGDWTGRNRWIWPAAGVLILWAVLSIVTSRFTPSGPLTGAGGVRVAHGIHAIGLYGAV